MATCRNHFARVAAAFALALMGFTSSTNAEVTGITVSSTQTYGEFAGGKFVRIEGEAFGVLSPTEAIPGLDKAPRNAAGLVEYHTPVTLIVPESPRAGNATLLVDVPNRGRAISLGLYNSPRTRPILVGSLDQGTGFLQNRGYSVAVVQWELGEGPTLPAFTDAAGKKLYAEGVGFAAVRDVTLFLRYASGTGNPLAGSIERAYAVGYSQTARFIKSFLLNGYNELGGKTVFDAVHIVNAAAGVMPLLDAGPGPASVASETPGHANPEFRGVHEEPFTYADTMKQVAAKYRKPPFVIVNNTYNDYLGGRAALTRTGAHGTTDIAIPENMRVYDIAGAPHTNSREKNKDCVEGQGQLDWSPALRAELVALDDWVRGKATPPASRLFALEARPNDPDVFQAPAYLPGAVVMAPKLDRDTNPPSGLQLPDILVPIASNGYMNAPRTVMACRQAGTYRPFAKTVAERKDKSDERLSLEERYPGGINEYVTKVRAATRALVAERLLLEEDAIVINHAAAENPSFAPTKPRSRGAAR
jgi:Alpha/beta hydrolase domain